MPTKARIVMRALLFLLLPFSGAAAIAGCGGDSVKTTVNVTLQEWQIAVCHDRGGREDQVPGHEQRHDDPRTRGRPVLNADGNKREVAEVEDVEKGTNAEFTAKLKAGTYQLACLIVPGEAAPRWTTTSKACIQSSSAVK